MQVSFVLLLANLFLREYFDCCFAFLMNDNEYQNNNFKSVRWPDATTCPYSSFRKTIKNQLRARVVKLNSSGLRGARP